jgi:hypothetical protein
MKRSTMARVAGVALAAGLTFAFTVALVAAIPAGYKGKPWKDAPQAVPGKIMVANFDVGGEGVAYHDTTKGCEGNGKLNGGNDEKSKFRKDEDPDCSFTKADWDKWKDTGKPLPTDVQYVGWTDAGEWLNYTVDVKEAGTYQLTLLASANNAGTQMSWDVNGKDATGPVNIEQTGNWHAWKLHTNICELKLEKGLNLITLKFVKEGNQNVQYFELTPKGAAKDAPKADAPKADAPKADAPKADAPKADAPKAATK